MYRGLSSLENKSITETFHYKEKYDSLGFNLHAVFKKDSLKQPKYINLELFIIKLITKDA